MIVYWTGGQAQCEGAMLLLAFAGLGVGLLLWARYLLPGHDITASRGHHVSSPEERAAVVESLSRGTEAMLARRGFLAEKVLVPVGGIFGIAPLAARLSGHPPGPRPLPHQVVLRGTARDRGRPPCHVDDVMVDGLLTVFPEGYMNDASSPAVCSISGGTGRGTGAARPSFEVVSGANGIVAFSKICTHAGCAVSLFNVLSMQLICPCHQSTFNILQDCEPVFGPASRPLPQLPLRGAARRLPHRPAATSSSRSAPASGTGRATDEHDGRAVRQPAKRAQLEQEGAGLGRRPLRLVEVAPLGAWTRSSRTTGRSWSARSPCTRFVILIATGIYLALVLHPHRAPWSSTTGPIKPLDGQSHDRGLPVGHQYLLQRAVRAGHAPGPPLGRPHLPGRRRCSTCAASSSPGPSASPGRSTGSSA